MRSARWRLAFGCIAACVTLSISAWGEAQPRTELPGFGNIQFGMTESDVRKSLAVSNDVDYVEEGKWLTGVTPLKIAGGKFVLKILIDQGLVRRISLLDLAPVDIPICQRGFDQMVSYVESLYGAPDTKERGVWAILRESYRARFKFADGAQVEVLSFLAKGGSACGNSIGFFLPQDALQDEALNPGDA